MTAGAVVAAVGVDEVKLNAYDLVEPCVLMVSRL